MNLIQLAGDFAGCKKLSRQRQHQRNFFGHQ
jgi:hypothetical protein